MSRFTNETVSSEFYGEFMRRINALEAGIIGDGGSVEFVLKWGAQGTGNGQFNAPYGIACDPERYVWVTDYDNGTIQKFTESGEFVEKWSGFSNPYGIAVTDEMVYVAESGTRLLLCYNKAGDFVASFDVQEWFGSGDAIPHGIGAWQQSDQVGVPYDTILVAVHGKRAISVVRRNVSTNFMYSDQGILFTGGNPAHLQGIGLGNPGSFFIGDYVNGKLFYNPFLDNYIAMRHDENTSPIAVARDANHNVYSVNYNQDTIDCLSPMLALQFSFGSSGTADGQFLFPHSIACDVDGNIYIGEEGNCRIQKFRRTGVGVSQTTFYAYRLPGQAPEGDRIRALGSPDGGVDIPSLNAMADAGFPEWRNTGYTGGDARVWQVVLDLRAAILRIVQTGFYKNPQTNQPYDWTDLSPNNLYHMTYSGWTFERDTNEAIGTPHYDIDMEEIDACLSVLEASRE